MRDVRRTPRSAVVPSRECARGAKLSKDTAARHHQLHLVVSRLNNALAKTTNGTACAPRVEAIHVSVLDVPMAPRPDNELAGPTPLHNVEILMMIAPERVIGRSDNPKILLERPGLVGQIRPDEGVGIIATGGIG